jgi:hypothetical protein
MNPRRTRSRIFLAWAGVIVMLVGGILVWWLGGSSEPRHGERTVTAWLEVIADPKSDVLTRDEAERAFIAFGTNALPVLTNRLLMEETVYYRWREKARDWPVSIRDRLPRAFPAAFWRRAAAKQITLLGSDASSAVPFLVQGLADPDRVVRGYCYNVLNRLRTPPEILVPGLITCLRSPDPSIRVFGAGELGFVGTEAKAGVPALIQALGDEDDSVRLNAIVALGRVGPAGRPAAPHLRELLQSPKPEVVLNSASTLTRLDVAEAKSAVPVLAELLKHQDNSIVENALRQLSDLGSHASTAVAQVEPLLHHPAPEIQRIAGGAPRLLPERGGCAGVGGFLG